MMARLIQTDFLCRHVFPNGDLAGLTETLTEMERARWEIVDVEGLRLHDARTCRQWVERLRARADEARALAGERSYRTWLLYLTCSAVAFERGAIGVYQVLLRKQVTPRGTRPPAPARTCTQRSVARTGPSGTQPVHRSDRARSLSCPVRPPSRGRAAEA